MIEMFTLRSKMWKAGTTKPLQMYAILDPSNESNVLYMGSTNNVSIVIDVTVKANGYNII